MLGDSITLTLGGTGGTDRVCTKVNQDNFGAVYLGRTSLDEIRIKVRHLKENPKAGSEIVERHEFYVTQTVYAAGDVPEKIRSHNMAIRSSASDDQDLATDLSEAVTLWGSEANILKLFGWES